MRALPLVTGLIGLVMAGLALGAEGEPRNWSGYGSLSGHRAEGSGFRLRPDPSVASARAPGDWRWDGDSRLGLQWRRGWGGDAETVAQAEWSDDIERRWRARLVWAYLNLRLGDAWSLRLGRQTLPTLRYSETRTVGYAQAAVRPLLPIYQLNPGSPVDGINLSWEGEVADGTLRLDLGLGRTSAQRAQFRVDVRQSQVLALQWQRHDWLFRLSGGGTRLDLSADPLAALAASGQCLNCDALRAQRGRNRDIRSQIYSALLLWEPGAWEWSLEFLERPRKQSALIPAARAWTLMGVWRLGPLQPHIAVGENRFREPLLGLQPSSPDLTLRLAALDRLLVQRDQDLHVWRAGLRWDFAPQLALKLQHERWRALRDRNGSRQGVLEISVAPLSSSAPSWNGVVGLTSISLDFIF